MRAYLLGIALSFLVAGFTVHAADRETATLQVTVKDAHGQPAAYVQLWLERYNSKSDQKNAVTDSTGHAVFTQLVKGTYKISAVDRRIPAAAAAAVKTSAGQTTSVTLSLDKMVGTARPTKKKKHYVYVAEETGTHIGGGRWVEVDDNAVGTGASSVDKLSGRAVTGPGSNLRPFVNPAVAPGGGN